MRKDRSLIIIKALNNTVKKYKEIYYENNYYRLKKVLDCEKDPANTSQALNSFFESPFEEDRAFTVSYLAQVSRDKLDENIPIVNSLFFDKVIHILKKTDKKTNESLLK